MTSRKLVLCVVDSLRTETLERAAADGTAPAFAALIERGTLVRDCVSAFPSVTPVCTSSITTGHGPAGHWISGMNTYHRAERRYVEYGSSFEATRAFGLFRSLYDTVYNMNMAHLSDEVETVFETLGDRGVRTACTPFLIYRGRTRHEMGLEGLLRRVALAATFRHATWGPDELFYGELYTSRRVPCTPTLARPGTRDEYSACCGRELAENDLYDFLLYSLPDNDYHSHKFGPEAQSESIVHADAAFAELVDAGGGLDRFLERNAVILVADHAQTEVTHDLPLASTTGRRLAGAAAERERPRHRRARGLPELARRRRVCARRWPAGPPPARGRSRAASRARRGRPGVLARARRRAGAAGGRRRPGAAGLRGGRGARRLRPAFPPGAGARAIVAARAGPSMAITRCSRAGVSGGVFDSERYPNAARPAVVGAVRASRG